jgi:hypothetical protein
MSKYLGALMVVLCLSLFGAGAASAFSSPSEAAFVSEGDGKGKKKNKKKSAKKPGKKHKKHGKKKNKK